MRFRTLAFRDASALWRSGRVRALIITSAVLTTVVITVAARDYTFREQQYSRRQVDRLIAGQKEDGFLMGWSAEPSLRALRAPSLESVAVRGLDSLRPSFSDVTPAGVVQGAPDPSLVDDLQVGALFDLESVIRIVLGLLALLVALQLVATERSTGTLRALLAVPVEVSTVLAAKVFAGSLIMSTALVIVGSVAGATALLTLGAGPALRLANFFGLFLPVSLLYLLALMLAGIVAGSVIRRHETVVVVNITLWIGLILVAPQVVTFGSRLLAPVPPHQVLERDRDAVFDARLYQTERELGSTFRRLFEVPTIKSPPVPAHVHDAIENLWTRDSAATREILDDMEDHWLRAEATQQELSSWLSRLTPGTLFTEIATDLADTGRAASARWIHGVAAYQQYLNHQLFDNRPRLTMRIEHDQGIMVERFDRHSRPNIKDLERFDDQASSVRSRLVESRPALIILLGWFCCLAGISYLVFPRTE